MSYVYVSLWIFLSCSVIVFNKYILDKNLYNWPYPIRSVLAALTQTRGAKSTERFQQTTGPTPSGQ